jgi:hypothetical protein
MTTVPVVDANERALMLSISIASPACNKWPLVVVAVPPSFFHRMFPAPVSTEMRACVAVDGTVSADAVVVIDSAYWPPVTFVGIQGATSDFAA